MKYCWAIAFGLALCGCQSLASDATQEVAISTSPPGATCTVSGDSGSWTVVAPGKVRILRGRDVLMVDCALPGLRAVKLLLPRPSKTYGRTAPGDPTLPGMVNMNTRSFWIYPEAIDVVLKPER